MFSFISRFRFIAPSRILEVSVIGDEISQREAELINFVPREILNFFRQNGLKGISSLFSIYLLESFFDDRPHHDDLKLTYAERYF